MRVIAFGAEKSQKSAVAGFDCLERVKTTHDGDENEVRL